MGLICHGADAECGEQTMGIAEQALWILERNSAQQLGLNDIAAACGVSRSHLANAFGTATGRPVMQYLKARRLSEAAQRLAAGAPDILTVALDFGYGSHEAFTRAFRDQFGVTPQQVRAGGSVEGIVITAPLLISNGPSRPIQHGLQQLGRRRFIGLAVPCSWHETVHIPGQWQRFVSEFYEDIARRVQQMPVGMCEAPDEDGCFRYIAAAEVEAFERHASELISIEIAPTTYAVFEHEGHVSTIFNTYGAIWNEALSAIGRTAAPGPSLEFHNDAFDPDTGLGGVRIFVPLQD